MITVLVKDRDIYANSLRPITSGSVGIPVRFSFDKAWDDLAKTAVFRGSGTSVDVALQTEDACVVPDAVLSNAGGDLLIGVYGTNSGGTVAIPTTWANAGYIYEGATPSNTE